MKKIHYLLDTNICIYIIKHKPVGVLERFEALSVGTVGMSAVTYGELLFGAEKSHSSKQAFAILDKITTFIPPLPLLPEASKYYGGIRAKLEKKGQLIGNNDLWIAAHALALKLILVTNNVREFKKIPGLKIENWAE